MNDKISYEELERYKETGLAFINSTIKKKYCLQNEKTLLDIINRSMSPLKDKLSNERYDYIYNMFLDNRCLPAGSILFSLGNTERKSSLSNCYFIPIENDSIEGIYDCCKNMAKTFASRGGVGIDITVLRPKGSPTNNSALTSTGAVSFMPTFDDVSYTIGQFGRRGAEIISIDVRHPDVLDFIWSKSRSKEVFGVDQLSGKTRDLSNCNITVKLTDKFINAVKKDENFDLIFPDFENCKDIYDSEWDGDFDEWILKGYPIKTYKTLKAKDILKQLAESSWLSGDPGVAFWDNVIRWTPSSFDKRIKAFGFNPCLPSWAPILTPYGYKRLKNIKNEILINNQTLNCSDVFKSGENQELYELKLKNGINLYATHNHKISVLENNNVIDIELSNINIQNHKIKVDYSPITYEINNDDYEKGIIAGWIFGDGSIGKKTKTSYFISVALGIEEFNKEQFLLNIFKKYIPEPDNLEFKQYKKTCKILNITKNVQKDYIIKYILNCDNKNDFDLLNNTISFQIGFISALISCDGYAYNKINSKKKVNRQFVLLNQSGERGFKILQDIQFVLASLDIYSSLTISNHAKIDKRGVNCQTSWHLEIVDVENFNKHFKIFNDKKQYTIEEICKNFSNIKRLRISNLKKYQKIKSIQKINNEDVFDINVPNENHFIASTIQVHNCGEQTLGKWLNCLLGSMCLHKYVIHPYTNIAEFNMELFESDVKHMIIFLDTLIDINNHPLKQQTEMDLYARRVGLGFTGLADMLAMLNLEYDEEKAFEFVDDLLFNKYTIELNTSIELSKEFGPAPCFSDKKSRSLFIKQPFIQRVLNRMFPTRRESFIDNIKQHGLRNSALNTVAPTGSISIISDNCSSGMEPVFDILYERSGRINEKTTIYHYPILKYGNLTSTVSKDELKKKYHYKTAYDINYKDRIRMQSVVQKWTDASISSTINLPNNCTIEDIYNIYLQAHSAGLKGITIFRDSSKGSVLSTIKENGNGNGNNIDELTIKHSEIRQIISEFLPKIKKQLRERHRGYRDIVKWYGEDVYLNIVLGKDDHPMEVFAKVPEELAINKQTGEFDSGIYNEYLTYWDTICRNDRRDRS